MGLKTKNMITIVFILGTAFVAWFFYWLIFKEPFKTKR